MMPVLRGRLVLCALALVVAGCSAAGPVVSPRPWDKYKDGESLEVRGADPATAGQIVFQALRDEPNLRGFLDREGEPDTLEIRGGRFSSKTIVLKYTRPESGKPRTITLDPSGKGFIPRAPVPLATPQPKKPGAKKPAARRPAPAKASEPSDGAPAAAPVSDTAPAAAPAAAPADPPPASATGRPTAEQALGCPIDPSRPDCQTLCVPGADHEWCGP